MNHLEKRKFVRNSKNHFERIEMFRYAPIPPTKLIRRLEAKKALLAREKADYATRIK